MQKHILEYFLIFLFLILLIIGLVRSFIKANDSFVSWTKARYKADREFFTFIFIGCIPLAILMWIENRNTIASVTCILLPLLLLWGLSSGSVWLTDRINTILLRKRIDRRKKHLDH